MTNQEGQISPLERWLEANRNVPNLGASLRLLLGHAFVGILRQTHPDFTVFSPEKAISFVQRLPEEALPRGFGNWLSKPTEHALEIVHFCESSRNFRFSQNVNLSQFSSGAVDLRGVRCPMGSVRARLVTAGLEPGEKVTFFLDDGEPIENVPRAMVEDGNHVIFREKKEKYWELCVQKREIK